MNSLARGFRALRHTNFRLYWTGQLISLCGTWMQQVAQSWLVLQITGSPIDLGIVAALQTLPVLFVSAFAGVVADRVSKRSVMVVTQSVQMLLALLLGVLVVTHLVQIWHVYILAALLGLTNAFDMPTRQSFMIEMVGREDLMSAVALQSMQFNAARIVGPALAGLLIAAIGVTGSFFANAISFVPVIFGLLAMRTDRFYTPPAVEHLPVSKSLSQGWRYVRMTPAVLMITLVVAVLGLFNNNINVLVPLFAKNVLQVGPQGYGMLMAMMGFGSLGGALVASLAQRARWRVLFGGAFVYFIFQLGFAFSRIYPLSLLFMAISGFSVILFFTSANTGVQTKVPDSLRGRVMGVYMAVNVGMSPIGNLTVGWLADRFGAPVALALGCVVALTCLTVAAAWLLAHRHSKELEISPVPQPLRSLPVAELAEAAG
jgi:MFS family permease